MKGRIHIGNLIHDKLKEDGRSGTWLAEKINCNGSNISKILKRPSINIDLLLDISLALEKNFFLYYSDIYHDKIQKKQHKSIGDTQVSKSDAILYIMEGNKRPTF